MKKFIVSVLCAAVFFTGLGGLIEKAGATFKSDEKALELIGKARRAIGGDAAIGGVRSMTITGNVTKTFEIEGAPRSEQGDLEINFELPNKMNRRLKIGSGEGSALVDKKVDVFVLNKDDADNVRFRTENPEAVRKIIVEKSDGTTGEIKIDGKEPLIFSRTDGRTIVSEDGTAATVDGQKVFVRKTDALGGEFKRSNELFRTTLSLLLSAPEGIDVSYTYAGEGSVDGFSCDIIAAADNGSTIKLYLDKSTSLPRMMTYQGHQPLVIKFNKGEVAPNGDGEAKVLASRLAKPETAEFQVKFSDYRSVGGLQLPFKWTQTVAGKADESIDITNYEINPANIADKFNDMPTRVFVRTKKEQ